MSTQKSTSRGSQPFQLRLDSDLRSGMEKAQKQDGDESLAAWMKRIIRKELQQRGIEPKS